MDLQETLLLVVAGFITGAINSVAGGGSLMTFPALLWVGLPPISASVTNSVSVAFGYVGSVAGSRPGLVGQAARMRTLVPAAAAGACLGCGLLLGMPTRVFEWAAPALVLGASLLMVFQHKIKVAVHDQPGWMAPLAVFGVGVYGGYFISALGVLILAVFSLVLHDQVKRVVALKNVIQLTVGLVALTAYSLFGPVEWKAVVALVPGALLGGFLGTRVFRNLNANVLRWVVVGFGFVVAALLFARAA